MLSDNSRGMIRNKNNKETTESVKLTCRLLSYSYNKGIPARISEFWHILFRTYDKKSPEEYIDYWDYNTVMFESYLFDTYSKWQKGEDIDFEELQNKILPLVESSSMRKVFTGSGDFQDRLWAIFLFLSDPDIKL